MKTNHPSLFLLAALVSFPQLSETIYTPSLPELTRYFSTTANMMQNSLSIYFLGFALGVFVFGRLCDTIGRKASLMLGLLIYVVASFLCLFSGTISLFLVSRLLQAFGASVGSVVTQTLLRDQFTGEERARIFSKLTAVIAFAPAMGPFIGSQLSYAFSPMMNFWFLAVLGIVLMVISGLKLEETYKKTQEATTKIIPLALQMLRDKHIWTCATFIAVHNGILFSFHAEAPFILIEMLNMDPAHYGVMGLILGASVFLGSMINTRLLGRFSSYQLNFLGCIIMTCATCMLVSLVPMHAYLSDTSMRMLYLMDIALTIIGLGISLPNCLSIALKDYRHAVGTAGAILGALYYVMIGGLLGIMSIIHNGTLWPLPIYFLVLSTLLSSIALSMMRVKRHQQV